MMYRLKSEAVPFFKDKLKTAVLEWDVWTKTYNVNESALEEVKPCYLTYGHEHYLKRDDGTKFKTATLGGWHGAEDGGAAFHFTVHFPSMKMREYDEFSNGDLTRRMMDSVQCTIDNFYRKFNDEQSEDEE